MSFIVFLFCFFNLYGPFSTNIAFAFNVLLFFYVIIKRPQIILERTFIAIPILLLVISVFAFYNTRDSYSDASTFGIYMRLLVSSFIYPTIIAFFYRKNIDLYKILSFALFLHCVTIIFQLIAPQLQEYNRILFRFDRDNLELSDYSLRRLGLLGGFDQSALYTILSCLLAIELYFQKRSKIFALFFVISFVASLFTSRTGMVFCVIALLFSLFINRKLLYGRKKRAIIFVVVLIGMASVYFILPIVLNSIGVSYGNAVANTDSQYSDRTSDYLFDFHLFPLLILNTKELLWGYGCSVNKASVLMTGSDIGYVKQIYQIGIIGVCCIILFCALMTKRTTKRFRRLKGDTVIRIGTHLLWVFLPLYIVFNYKNHLLYNVCYFEPFLFVYYYTYYHYVCRMSNA